MTRKNLLEEYEAIRKETKAEICLFEKGGHPSLYSNAEAAAAAICKFLSESGKTMCKGKKDELCPIPEVGKNVTQDLREPEIFLEKVTSDKKEILFRLLQYSLFEESIEDGNHMGEDGLFAYPWFEQYFKEKDREAYFIKEKKTKKLQGFVMINTYVQRCTLGHSIAEVMLLPNYRRQKIGEQAAFLCFEKYRGNWEVSPSRGNEGAYLFWQHVIQEYTDGKYSWEDGICLFQA